MVLEIVTSVVLLVVGIAVLVIIHVCMVGRTFRMNQESIESGTLVQSSCTISEDDIKKLPWYDYKMDEDDDDDDDVDEKKRTAECTVCLEGFKVGDKCRLLPNCSHSFHVNCIDSWLIKTAACPICRTCVDLRTKLLEGK
ncbi:RING-H2 finger protein ATL16-like [Cynara cardunculus var. scolymus]|uniref:Zinc finger, RING/FYVE/PHD-type n=1 Tax=Cynara cardunculus var. scolymus TaxID=59895 RepID=A0A103XXV1_CYNCS|nr:RING-H2 finger protein ATL16-like [Cynara cardunculus var. scolymus]KVH98945.1 Zinc finger, RING/FYVE/PHD-type [Cynara cardunculus var. scolymus]